MAEQTTDDVQTVKIEIMPDLSKKHIFQPAIKKEEHIFSHLISYTQGDEEILQDAVLDFFSTNPKILYSFNWTVGIATYFMFIYR
jgi:hypothetical protein